MRYAYTTFIASRSETTLLPLVCFVAGVPPCVLLLTRRVFTEHAGFKLYAQRRNISKVMATPPVVMTEEGASSTKGADTNQTGWVDFDHIEFVPLRL